MDIDQEDQQFNEVDNEIIEEDLNNIQNEVADIQFDNHIA